MTILFFALFIVSLVLIIGLFAVKHWELSHDSQFYPDLRVRADESALRLKDVLAHSREYAGEIPPLLVRLMSIAVHKGALAFAALARILERSAYKIADFVSHRRYFSPRETRSEFLQKVSEYKNDAVMPR
jgi:hypothetical protein